MGDPVSQELFFATIEQLRADGLERHRSIRLDLQNGFRDLGAKLEEHAKEDRVVADRLLTMEIQRGDEKAMAIKRGTWAGILAATVLNMAWQVLEWVGGRR